MESVITGKAYVLGDNVDTDQIIPAQYLSFNPSLPEERKFFGMYAMSSVPEGQRGLPQGNIPFMREGEFRSDFTIIIGGKNFGMGSSRPAARNLKNLGIACLVADSINGLFYRNSVNFALPAMECSGVERLLSEGEVAEVDFDAGTVRNANTGASVPARKVPRELLDIVNAGGIFALLEREGSIAPK